MTSRNKISQAMHRAQLTVSGAAEDWICDLIKAKGWIICDRNFRAIGTELDIIARKKGTGGGRLMVVEVKYRKYRPQFMSEVEILVPWKKMQALRRGIKLWLARSDDTYEYISCYLAVVIPEVNSYEMKNKTFKLAQFTRLEICD